MKKKILTFLERFVVKKETKEEKINDVLYGRSGDVYFFRDKNLIIVVSIVTLFLQIISFVTTYQGAKTYFEEIFVLAPLLFALSIQIVVYFLANSVRRKATLFMILSLILGVSCSTYFSYIGIYNVVNSPQKYLEEVYSNYELQLVEKYEAVQLSLKTQTNDAINELMNGIVENVDVLQQKIDTYEAMQKEIKRVNSNVSSSMTPPQRYQYERYEDYALAYNAYLASVSNNSQVENEKKVAAILSKYGFNNNQEAVEALSNASSLKNMAMTSVAQVAKEMNIDSKNFTGQIEGLRNLLLNAKEDSNVEQVVSQLFNVYSALGAKQLTSSTDVTSLIANQSETKEPFMLSYDDYSSLKATNGESLIQAPMQLKERMDSEISKKVNEINILAELANDQSLKANKKDYMIYDMYTLPMVNIMNKNTRPMALFCFILAALVDLLSILFAFIVRKRPSVLIQKKVSSLFHGGDEQLSEMINDAVALSLARAKNISLNECLKPEIIVEGLSSFLNLFETSNLAIQEGYSMICEEKELHCYAELVSILNQLNFLKIVPKRNLFNEESEESIVLLKTKFVIWATKRISETIQMISEVD